MINLYEQSNNTLLGQITQEQLQFLIEQLEEESLEDKDYSITPMILAFFEAQGADGGLLALLRSALGEKEEVIVRWSSK
jgi:processive 1,2-diacylglycerol beta-glucosyltransferase